jgi:hypothetical protein
VNPDPNQPSDLVEFTRNGQFVNQLSISNTPGAAFGLGLTTSDQAIFLGAVNDVDHTLEVWKHFFPTQKKTG